MKTYNFFRHLTASHKCQCVNINLLVTMRCKDVIMKMLSCVQNYMSLERVNEVIKFLQSCRNPC